MASNIVELRTPHGQESIEQLLEQVTIRCLDDIQDAASTMARVAAERGLKFASCDDISARVTMADAEGTLLNPDVFGWVEDGERWWEDHQLALRSPLVIACRYESEPFWMNRDGFYTMWRNSYLDEIDLSDFDKHLISNAAIVVPVHLPFGQISANSFASLDRAKTDLSVEFAQHGALLAQLTQRFIAGYAQAHRTTRRIPADCGLSKREAECLRWAAIGKTDKEISMILDRSHATVRYHIHRAGEKLDSVNRAQTIFKAGQLGYLGASD